MLGNGPMVRVSAMRRMVIAGMAGVLAAGLAGLGDSDAAASEDCAAHVSFSCLKSFGAGSRPVPGSDCDAEMRAYRACLSLAAASAPAPETRALACDGRTARDLWADAKADNDCLGYQAFLEACPAAPQARLAEARTKRLRCGADQAGEAAQAAAHAADRAKDVPDAIRARHLLVETEAKAQAIRREILLDPGVASFARAAERYSTGPSAKNGGELGQFRRGMMVQPFEDVVFSLGVGEVSQPFRTQFGWHLAMRTE